MLEKKCSSCERVEPVANFYKYTRRLDGLYTWCKMCDYTRRLLSELVLDDKAREALRKKKKERNRQYNIRNKEHVLAYRLAYYQANREHKLQYRKDWYEANREYCLEYAKSPKVVAYREKFRKENPGYYRNQTLIRQKKLRQRTFPHEKEALTLFYQNCPEGYHVDHIVPITHPLVSGLHVLANLQYLTAEENKRKFNRFEIGD